jgi:glycosyltransferase involved in cell wall biosynthesis
VPDIRQLNLCLLEPYFGGSHRRWAEAYRAHSSHKIRILPLPARHWKWRMHGAAVTFARELAASGETHDLILASDMMDVAVFSGLLRERGIHTPVASYFHENQLGYPVSPRDTDRTAGRDLHYGFINYTTALASEKVYFNSHYHRKSFLDGLGDLLRSFPDTVDMGTIDDIAQRSEVLHLGIDLALLDACKPAPEKERDKPLLLWNHRWEHDKNPDEFLRLLLALHREGIPFEVAMLGERHEEPALLAEVRRALGPAILRDGPVDGFNEYVAWLWRADILPVTSLHDFFGTSVVEAVYCGCHPVLPRRLAYPEHFPGEPVFYDSFGEALEMLGSCIKSGVWRQASTLSHRVARYDWKKMAPVYDAAFCALLS